MLYSDASHLIFHRILVGEPINLPAPTLFVCIFRDFFMPPMIWNTGFYTYKDHLAA